MENEMYQIENVNIDELIALLSEYEGKTLNVQLNLKEFGLTSYICFEIFYF